MAINPDSSDKTGEKADLYSIIKRRKRTAENFIKEHKIKTIKDYNLFIKKLKEKFILSKKFLEDSKKAVLAEEVVKNESEKPVKPKKQTTGKKRTPKTTKKSYSKKITTSLSGSDYKNN